MSISTCSKLEVSNKDSLLSLINRVCVCARAKSSSMNLPFQDLISQVEDVVCTIVSLELFSLLRSQLLRNQKLNLLEIMLRELTFYARALIMSHMHSLSE